MAERWEFVGGGSSGISLEIEPGIDVWQYPWHEDPGGKMQIGASPEGPFVYVPVYYIVINGRRITFAADDMRMGSWVFYRLAT